ncbi:MAG TPA: 4Fe-4S dicluster domain-containing protein [Planctomycetota bacterium]|nr:4Fe-4S dicluster domain-containing protein [Planctomycetota bacterium]
MADPKPDSSEPNPPEASRSGKEERFDRRGFFSEGFRQLFRPLADALADQVESRLERAGIRLDDDARPSSYPTGARGAIARADLPEKPVLRPPGALGEDDFLDRCYSSGQCVQACPVNAIKLARSELPRLDQRPFIDPDVQACVVCDDLSCMKACPSGALSPIPKDAIDMGVAVVHYDLCVRTQGEDCQICVDKCPIGARAIEIPEGGGQVVVHEAGCTGCGVCQMYCPTDPRAVVVEPSRERRGKGGEVSQDGSYFPFSDLPPENGAD